MTTWSVTSESGGYTVRKGRSRRSQECPAMDDALQHIKTQFQPGDKVVLVEDDGYKTVITRQVARKGWRR